MQGRFFHKGGLTARALLPAALTVTVAATLAWQARAGGEAADFPEHFAAGVHYATVKRGNITEQLYTSRDAIEAAKSGKPFPSGTVITLVDSRDDQLFRYVVMQKRTGWGAELPDAQRAGDWKFQWFNPDKTVKADEDLGRCMSCHQQRASQDFVWSVDHMKKAP
jgi:hypothetical protein